MERRLPMGMNPQTLLRIGYGLVPIAAGADKFTNQLTDWEQYLSPAIKKALPIDGGTFMKLVGVVEIAAGVLVLSRWTKVGALLVAGWLGAITAQLISSRDHYDVAARDALLALGAVALAQMSPARARRDLGETTRERLVPEAASIH
jgi:uncharacterized membrane protein YphA (DoxX/SURF4 family)